ncbi:Protein of unknown function [Singulisphaera sp. GP187]|uniref:DUF1800 domain-containing protein n=1 Tax=Singulisphaera sp. GP187 TaxID=1882752 RepID=UPI0009297CB5|nr:DUF1800 domain-containing protein [Singulisphaera sp. GP187]SIO32065.1 Protein of unknown function [Singulisphaera sp. GP187]
MNLRLSRNEGLDPAEAWAPWTPTANDPWDRKWAGHLYRRAAFGASWPELQAALDSGPAATIDRLLAGREGQDDFDQLMDQLGPDNPQFQPQDGSETAIQDWWLQRLIHTMHPLRERLVLFWHNHFATSILKVRQPGLMKQQNILIRRHALGKFAPFLQEMSRDPAMLIWLDGNSNTRGKPNENYARELMELFTLGVGHYNETDVREAARAFTGWHTDGQKFTLNRFQHDDGKKSLLGQTGTWDGQDVIRIVLEQPAAARFLVRKLYRDLISEGEPPSDALLEPLAAQYRNSGYDTAALVGTMLRSRLFFSDQAYRQRIKSPVEYVVGMLRSLEAKAEPKTDYSTPQQPRLMDGLGQALFAPPNVKGWAGGEAWLNTATLLARHNLAWKVAQGTQGPLGISTNPPALVRKYASTRDPKGQVDFLLDLLLQPAPGEVDERASRKLAAFLANDKPSTTPSERRVRETMHAILLMPEYQLS